MKKLKESISKYLNVLEQYLTDRVKAVYNSLVPSDRRFMLSYLGAIHRRFNYSAFVADTLTSPAVIIKALLKQENENINLEPVLETQSQRFKSMKFKMLDFSLDNHPAVHDMRKVINFCTPQIKMMYPEALTYEQCIDLSKLLTFIDLDYASLLFELALQMNYLKKVTSINVIILEPSKNWYKDNELPNAEIFDKIVNELYKFSSSCLADIIPTAEQVMTPRYIKKLVENPGDVNNIIASLFKSMGFDEEDFREAIEMPNNENFDENSDSFRLFMSTVSLGFSLDKYFFVPFGYFFRLIQPHYMSYFNVEEELHDVINSFGEFNTMDMALHLPCTVYALTDLGLQYLKIEKTNSNYFDPDNISIDNLKDGILSSSDNLREVVEAVNGLESVYQELCIFTFKISLNSKKWVRIEIAENQSLHDLYVLLPILFSFKDSGRYSFFMGKTEDLFNEYLSPKKQKASKAKSSLITLDNLDIIERPNLLLVVDGQAPPFSGEPSKIRLNIELISTGKPELIVNYPIVTNVSKALRES